MKEKQAMNGKGHDILEEFGIKYELPKLGGDIPEDVLKSRDLALMAIGSRITYLNRAMTMSERDSNTENAFIVIKDLLETMKRSLILSKSELMIDIVLSLSIIIIGIIESPDEISTDLAKFCENIANKLNERCGI